MATKPVVVGVDGSEESLRAVEWAAMEARRHPGGLEPSGSVTPRTKVPR
jgi:nucleotide-binding universal stress UspA family protein